MKSLIKRGRGGEFAGKPGAEGFEASERVQGVLFLHQTTSRILLLIYLLSLQPLGALAASGKRGKGDQSSDRPVREEYAYKDHSKSARPVLGEQSTLSEYLLYAALNNPGLEAAFNRWKAALEKVTQVKSLPDPTFNYTNFFRDVETRVGPQEQKVGLAQRFPWFGKLRLRGEVAMEEANAAYELFEAERLALFFEVKDIYYEYYYLHRSVAITRDNIELLKDLEGVAQSEYKAGSPIAGLIKAQVELGRLDDRLRSLLDLRGPIVSKLNTALNRPYNASLPWPVKAPFFAAELTEEKLFAQMVEENPRLKSLAFKVTREEKSIRLAKKDFYPDFTLGLDYVDTGSAITTGVPGSGKDPVIGMVTVNLPLWRKKYRAGVEEAERRHEAASLTLQNTENSIEADLKMAVYRFNDAKRKIDLFRDTLVPQAKQSLNVTEEAYRAGNVDFLSLIDAQRLLLEFELSFERALANREQKLAEIEMLVGREIPKRRIEKHLK